jgi:hypothetical protein
MPVTWEFRNRVLVVSLDGDYEYHAPVRAITEAMHHPSFLPGTMLLIDARLTTTRRSSDEFRERAIWMASLQEKGLASRCALVIPSQTHQYGLARMAATHVEMHGMELQIFTDIEAASQWLLGQASATSAGLD